MKVHNCETKSTGGEHMKISRLELQEASLQLLMFSLSIGGELATTPTWYGLMATNLICSILTFYKFVYIYLLECGYFILYENG